MSDQLSRAHRGERVSFAAVLALCTCEAACDRGGPALPDAPVESRSEARQQDRFRQPERLIAALGLRPGDAVAEVGAGGGYLTLRIARAVGPTGHVVATDIDAAALDALGRRALAARMPQVETRLVPANAPSLERARYDLVFLAEVDHLLPDRAAYLRALVPTLKPVGRIAVSNRERHRAALLSAAGSLGLVAVESRVGLADQFLLFLTPPPETRP